MSDFRKNKVLLSAAYKNGTFLKQDYPVPARVSVEPIPGADKYKELNLRLVVDTADAEELLEGFTHGTVSLLAEQMLTPLDRDAKS